MNNKIGYYLEEVDRLLRGGEQYPITCEIDPSNRCQNDCKFCISAKSRSENPVDLDFDLYVRLLDELHAVGVKSITFTGGGEPLVNNYFESMAKLASGRFQLGLITNGILLNQVVPFLDRFRFVRVSLDAASVETYKALKGWDGFENVINNVKEAVGRKGSTIIGLSFVVCKLNENEICGAKELAGKLGVDYIQFKPVYQDGCYKVDSGHKVVWTERYKPDSALPCKIAGLVGIVGAEGKVWYCCIHRGEQDFLVGDLREKSFRELMEKRNRMAPDRSRCLTCRYMNYAVGYRELSKPKFVYLRHRDFL